MSVKALQDYVYVTKYARFRKDLGRRESFEESVDRVIDMHRQKYAGIDIEKELALCSDAIKRRLVLGSQRALQFGGKPILDKEARIYNCTTSYCDRPRFFQECLWLLLCGCGTGFSVQKHHVAKLPNLRSPTRPGRTFVVPDTIEGWGDALGALLASYGIVAPEFANDHEDRYVTFDFSQVRPEGSPLASGSGKAPGPGPLRNALEKIRALLDDCLANNRMRLRPIDAYDIVMHASDAVLSGGVRRSATICLFSVDDQEMLTAKTGDWFIKNPQRGRSNNSAVLLRDATSRETFNAMMTSVKEFGEPGFVWADSTEIMYNPCVEIGLYPAISHHDLFELTGVVAEKPDASDTISGWAFCNLCEINMKACVDEETWALACRAAALLGTMQAGYAKFDYLGPVSGAIAKREALLGCSMTGMMDNPNMAFDPALQRKMAQLILDVNAEFAPKIGVRPTARATCVKPAGSTSCILGTSSGIHAHHAKRYFRRAQGNKLESTLQYFEAHNPRHVEPSVWSANKTDKSVIFCIEISDDALTKGTVGALEQLKYVKLTQENWVDSGRVLERCSAPFLRHNVSNTINVQQDEWDAVAAYIYDNRNAFAGISLLSHSGDKDYPQAPFCEVFTPTQIIANYGDGSLMASGLIVDGMHAFDNNLWAACSCALDIGEDLSVMPTGSLEDVQQKLTKIIQKRDWVRRAKKFAKNYFGNDVRKMTYCLKDVHNYKLWCDLNREYVDVDWSMLHEDSDKTAKVETDAACAGGKCEIL